MEAWVNGVSTRAVDDLVQALGIGSGISKSEVSRICLGLEEQVEAFRTRTLHHTTFPYVFLDATYLHVRRTGQVTTMAAVVATGVTATDGRETLGVDVGDSEDEVLAFTAYPRSNWTKVWSTNPKERLNREIKRRARVVGIFPNDASVIRLVGAVLNDAHQEWQVSDRGYLSEASMAKLDTASNTDAFVAINSGS